MLYKYHNCITDVSFFLNAKGKVWEYLRMNEFIDMWSEFILIWYDFIPIWNEFIHECDSFLGNEEA